MWIGFSAVAGAGAGPAPRGEAFSLESCQNWLPGEPHPATAERCVRLGPAGQCNTDLCAAPHSYVCELRPGGARGRGAPPASDQGRCPHKTHFSWPSWSSSYPWPEHCPLPALGSFLSRSVFVRCLLSTYCHLGLACTGGNRQRGRELGARHQVAQSHPGPPTLSSSAWDQYLIAHLPPQALCGTRRTSSWGRQVETCRDP